MKPMILLVEDNAQILRGNERMLNRRGYDTVTAATLAEAREKLNEKSPDAVVLDIMLPDGSGLDFMRELRKESNVPVLLLTGLTTPEDIVRGLEDGGDDYLTKPYDFSVLLAHLEALLRRAAHVPDKIVLGSLTLDIKANIALINETDMMLTQKEFVVLLMLAENVGRLVPTSQIYETVWKQKLDPTTSGAVKTVMSRLRRKLAGEFGIISDRATNGYIFTRVMG